MGMGGIAAYYPTTTEFHYASPQLPPGHDMFGDVVREAHRRKIRVVGRYDLSKILTGKGETATPFLPVPNIVFSPSGLTSDSNSFSALGSGGPNLNIENTFQFSDNVTWNKGVFGPKSTSATV